jgi:hypothetical protein
MKKVLSLVLALAMIIGCLAMAYAQTGTTASTTDTTTLSYAGPSAGYTWTIPSTVTLTPGSAVQNGNVEITKFIGAAGKTLQVVLTSTTNNFRVRQGSTSYYLSYTVGKTNEGTGVSAGDVIVSTPSGANLASSHPTQTLWFKLQAVGDTTAAVTGSYTDGVLFTASIINTPTS